KDAASNFVRLGLWVQAHRDVQVGQSSGPESFHGLGIGSPTRLGEDRTATETIPGGVLRAERHAAVESQLRLLELSGPLEGNAEPAMGPEMPRLLTGSRAKPLLGRRQGGFQVQTRQIQIAYCGRGGSTEMTIESGKPQVSDPAQVTVSGSDRLVFFREGHLLVCQPPETEGFPGLPPLGTPPTPPCGAP